MPLANKLPQVKDVPFQGYDVSEFNLNDVGLEAHSGPLFSDCFRLCLSSKRSLSRPASWTATRRILLAAP